MSERQSTKATDEIEHDKSGQDQDAQTLVIDEAAPTEYDADVEQRIPAHIELDGEKYRITLISSPVSDFHLRAYAKKCADVRGDGSDDSGIGAQAKANFEAATVLFNSVISDVRDFADEEKPDNWRDFFSASEKLNVVNNAILACYPVEVPVAQGKPSWKMESLRATTILRVLFDGFWIETRHTLRKGDAKALSEFNKIMLRENTAQSGGDARMNELARLYDQLHLAHEGYKGRVPIHHKSAALIGHLNKQVRVLGKN